MITLYSGDADSQVNAPPALNSIIPVGSKIHPSNEGDPKPWSIHLKGLARPKG